MTKKDYVKIAAVLNTLEHTMPLDEDKNPCASILDVANALADMLIEDNPRFDRNRFINAVVK